jgi:hypothetical protein
MHISYTLTIKSMTILLRKQKNIKCSTVETHHFSLGIASQNKKINEINGCKTIFAAHRAQRATNSTQQLLMAHNVS